MAKTLIGTACIALVVALSGCSDSSTSTGPGTTDTTHTSTAGISGLARDLIGTWRTDTTIQVKAGVYAAPVKIGITVAFHDDSSFVATVFGDSLLGMYPLTGDLYVENGSWKTPDTNTVVAHPGSCQAADTSTITISVGPLSTSLSAPFHQVTGTNTYVANTLSAATCPDSTVLSTRPVGGKVKIDLPVDLPQLGKATWHLTFTQQS